MTRAVRRATIDDRWAIHEVARESWHAAYDDIFGADRVDDVVSDWYAIGDLESAIVGTNGRENAAFLVAEAAAEDAAADGAKHDPDLDGFAHAVPWPEDTSVAFLARLYVRPDRWNEGIGTALFERLETLLATEFDRLRLAVLASNDVGVSFYESRGFEHVATRGSDLGPGLEEYVYEKPIPDADE